MSKMPNEVLQSDDVANNDIAPSNQVEGEVPEGTIIQSTSVDCGDIQFANNESNEPDDKENNSTNEDKTIKASGVAYAGGMINTGWGSNIIVDLKGLELSENTPLLVNHYNDVQARIGAVTPRIEGNQLLYDAIIAAETPEAKNIISQGKLGIKWQVSIGASVNKVEFVDEKTSKTINGQKYEGPFYHVLQSELREISVVAVGADKNSTMQITASLNLKGGFMPENKTSVQTEQAVTAQNSADILSAERARVAEIQAICNGEFSEIEKNAIQAGLDANEVRKQVLEAIRAKRPEQNVQVICKSATEKDANFIEAALSLRAGIKEDTLLAEFGEKTLEMADKARSMSLKEMMIEAMAVEKIEASHCNFDNAEIKAAFSTVSVPNILSNVANKKMLQSFTAQSLIAPRLCSTGDLNDFKVSQRVRLTDVGDLLPLGADGEIKEGGITEETATNQLGTYGKKFCLTRQMIINDDLGAFLKIPTSMGNRAAHKIDQLFFERLLANPTQGDGNKLFSAKHKNYLSGETTALSYESLKKAITLFADQTDADGQPISVEPKFLLVPTALKHLAVELTRGTTLIATGSKEVIRPSLNVITEDDLTAISSPYLANASYIGNSATAWYLFGDPNTVDTFEIGYLNGKRTPTVMQGQTDFNTLGMWFSVYFDLGVREQSYRGMVKVEGK